MDTFTISLSDKAFLVFLLAIWNSVDWYIDPFLSIPLSSTYSTFRLESIKMSRTETPPRPRILPSTTASPLLSPTGPPCMKTSSPKETDQASAILSKLTTRSKARSTQNTPFSQEGTDYFSRKSPPYARSVTGNQETKESGCGISSDSLTLTICSQLPASAYISFPEFDQYQRRDAITADDRWNTESNSDFDWWNQWRAKLADQDMDSSPPRRLHLWSNYKGYEGRCEREISIRPGKAS